MYYMHICKNELLPVPAPGVAVFIVHFDPQHSPYHLYVLKFRFPLKNGHMNITICHCLSFIVIDLFGTRRAFVMLGYSTRHKYHSIEYHEHVIKYFNVHEPVMKCFNVEINLSIILEVGNIP